MISAFDFWKTLNRHKQWPPFDNGENTSKIMMIEIKVWKFAAQ